jgi:plastocyanin
MPRLRPRIAVIAVLAVLLPGCGGNGGSAAGSGPSPGPARIEIRDFKFVPDTLSVPSGQVVTVVNDDTTAHTVTARDGSFDSGDLAPGKSYTFTAGAAGQHPFICNIHQYMTGTLRIS